MRKREIFHCRSSHQKDASPIPEKKQKMESSPSLSPKELKKQLKESNDEESPKDHEDEDKKNGEETDSRNQETAKREKKRRTYEEEREKAMKKKKLFPTALPPRELKKLISGSEKADSIRNSLRELKSQEQKKREDSLPPKSEEKKKEAIPSPSLSNEKKHQESPSPQKATVENIVSTPKIPKKKEFAARRQEMEKSDKSPPPRETMKGSSPIVTTPKMQRNREFALRRQGTTKKAKTPSRLSLVPKPRGAHSPVKKDACSPATGEDKEEEDNLMPEMKEEHEIPITHSVEEPMIEENQPLEATSSVANDEEKEESPLSQETIEPELAFDATEEENEEILPIEDLVEWVNEEITPKSQYIPLDPTESTAEEPAISPSEAQENEDSSQVPNESAEESNIQHDDSKEMDTSAPVFVESLEQEHSIPHPKKQIMQEEPSSIPPLTEPQPDISLPIFQEQPYPAQVTESVAEEIIPSKDPKIQDPLARACAICLCKTPRERVFYTGKIFHEF